MGSKHSPTPWHHDQTEVRDSDDWRVVECLGPSITERAYENARLIVHRVNTYEALEAERDRYRAALEELSFCAGITVQKAEEACDPNCEGPLYEDFCFEDTLAALKAAKAALINEGEKNMRLLTPEYRAARDELEGLVNGGE